MKKAYYQKYIVLFILIFGCIFKLSAQSIINNIGINIDFYRTGSYKLCGNSYEHISFGVFGGKQIFKNNSYITLGLNYRPTNICADNKLAIYSVPIILNYNIFKEQIYVAGGIGFRYQNATSKHVLFETSSKRIYKLNLFALSYEFGIQIQKEINDKIDIAAQGYISTNITNTFNNLGDKFTDITYKGIIISIIYNLPQLSEK